MPKFAAFFAKSERFERFWANFSLNASSHRACRHQMRAAARRRLFRASLPSAAAFFFCPRQPFAQVSLLSSFKNYIHIHFNIFPHRLHDNNEKGRAHRLRSSFPLAMFVLLVSNIFRFVRKTLDLKLFGHESLKADSALIPWH